MQPREDYRYSLNPDAALFSPRFKKMPPANLYWQEMQWLNYNLRKERENSKLELMRLEEKILKEKQWNPNPEISRRLEATILHYPGASPEVEYPEDVTLFCEKGNVTANKSVLRMHSSHFFYALACDSTAVIGHDWRDMKRIVDLLTKGRACVLKSRVPLIMSLLKTFGVFGVFDSCTDSHKVKQPIHLVLPTEDRKYEVVQKDPDVDYLSQVRCKKCNNVFIKSTFDLHWDEYHGERNEKFTCGEEEFKTKFDYVKHKQACRFHDY